MTARPESTQRCPTCGSQTLCKMHGLGLKICYDCGTEFRWTLDEGQKPIFEGTAPDADFVQERAEETPG